MESPAQPSEESKGCTLMRKGMVYDPPCRIMLLQLKVVHISAIEVNQRIHTSCEPMATRSASLTPPAHNMELATLMESPAQPLEESKGCTLMRKGMVYDPPCRIIHTKYGTIQQPPAPTLMQLKVVHISAIEMNQRIHTSCEPMATRSASLTPPAHNMELAALMESPAQQSDESKGCTLMRKGMVYDPPCRIIHTKYGTIQQPAAPTLMQLKVVHISAIEMNQRIHTSCEPMATRSASLTPPAHNMELATLMESPAQPSDESKGRTLMRKGMVYDLPCRIIHSNSSTTTATAYSIRVMLGDILAIEVDQRIL